MTLLDTLREDLKESNEKIIVNTIFNLAFSQGFRKVENMPRSTTLGTAKSLLEFYGLVKEAIDNYETRSGVIDTAKVVFTEEEPNIKAQNETIVFSLIKRSPGAFGQGAPFESSVKNQRPIVREQGDDPTFPGYRQIVLGYWYDNLVRFTCWARTNKAANTRAEWFEDFMEEYAWWFKLQGVDRVLFYGRQADIVTSVNNNRWYGRPIDFFVRTEKIRVYSEKTLEEILIKVGITD